MNVRATSATNDFHRMRRWAAYISIYVYMGGTGRAGTSTHMNCTSPSRFEGNRSEWSMRPRFSLLCHRSTAPGWSPSTSPVRPRKQRSLRETVVWSEGLRRFRNGPRLHVFCSLTFFPPRCSLLARCPFAVICPKARVNAGLSQHHGAGEPSKQAVPRREACCLFLCPFSDVAIARRRWAARLSGAST